MVSFFHVSTPFKNALVAIPVLYIHPVKGLVGKEKKKERKDSVVNNFLAYENY